MLNRIWHLKHECLSCLYGLSGVLPSQKVLEYAVKAGLALKCDLEV